MNCLKVEERLSEYMESSLPAEEREQLNLHLQACAKCSALLEQMRTVVSLCRTFPVLDLDPDIVDRILLRTSGRPRRRCFSEIFTQYLVRPIWTPRFAAGAGLAVLFIFMLANFVAPRIPAALSAFSPSEFLGLMDRGVQQLYGQGLKAYDKKNELEAQVAYFKNNMLNKLRFMIGRIEFPMEGKSKSQEHGPRKERVPGEKDSGMLFPATGFKIDCI